MPIAVIVVVLSAPKSVKIAPIDKTSVVKKVLIMTELDITSIPNRAALSVGLDGFRSGPTKAAFIKRKGAAMAEESSASFIISRAMNRSGSLEKIIIELSGQVPKAITKMDIFQVVETSLKYSMSIIVFLAKKANTTKLATLSCSYPSERRY